MNENDLSKLKIDKGRALSGRKKRRVLYIFSLLILAFIFFFLYRKGILSPPLKVQTATVSLYHPSQSLTILNASGYVVPQRKSAIASKVTGRLIWVGVEEGSRVKKGQIIARLESKDLEAAKRQAEANVQVAQYNLEISKAELREATLWLERNKALFEKGVIPKASYDSAISRYEKAVSSVEAAQASLKAAIAGLEVTDTSLEYTIIRSPFDGIVLTKNADIGDIITPIGAAADAKSAVVTIADMDSLLVEADVSESNLSLIKKGQPCEIQLDGIPEKRFPGEIHMIVPTIDRTKATALVKIRFLEKDSRILPQMSAKVFFLSRPISPDEKKPTIAIHHSALIKKEESYRVFVITSEKVKEVRIKIGQKMGDMIEVVEGLKVGDRVILNPPSRLKDGKRVIVE